MLFSKPDKRKTDFLLRHPEMATNYICRNYPYNFAEMQEKEVMIEFLEMLPKYKKMNNFG